jgi:hypothetical protein
MVAVAAISMAAPGAGECRSKRDAGASSALVKGWEIKGNGVHTRLGDIRTACHDCDTTRCQLRREVIRMLPWVESSIKRI